MEPNFSTRVETSDGATVIYVSGEVDLATYERLRDAIEPHLGPNQRIVLDLAGLQFMDSSMLNILVQARGQLINEGGSLVLRNVSTAARRILAITDLEDMAEDKAPPRDSS